MWAYARQNVKHDSLHNSENLLFDHKPRSVFIAEPHNSKGHSFCLYFFGCVQCSSFLTFLQTAKVGVFLVQRDTNNTVNCLRLSSLRLQHTKSLNNVILKLTEPWNSKVRRRLRAGSQRNRSRAKTTMWVKLSEQKQNKDIRKRTERYGVTQQDGRSFSSTWSKSSAIRGGLSSSLGTVRWL